MPAVAILDQDPGWLHRRRDQRWRRFRIRRRRRVRRAIGGRSQLSVIDREVAFVTHQGHLSRGTDRFVASLGLVRPVAQPPAEPPTPVPRMVCPCGSRRRSISSLVGNPPFSFNTAADPGMWSRSSTSAGVMADQAQGDLADVEPFLIGQLGDRRRVVVADPGGERRAHGEAPLDQQLATLGVGLDRG